MERYAEVLINVPVKSSFTYSFDSEKMQVETGMRVQVKFGNRKMQAFVAAVSDTKPDVSFAIKPVERVIDREPVFSKELVSLALWMERFYLCSRGEALSSMIPGGRRDTNPPSMQFENELDFSPVVPSDEQQKALDEILTFNHKNVYIYGVTGSGKTEIFLRTAEAVIAQKKQVIYLVPEITLTVQLKKLAVSRFGSRVAILHSAMTPSQRIAVWKKIIRAEADLIIGARSAVFAPCPNLGLIVIDEEHENSYKAGNSPRYHARQVAQIRCRNNGAMLLMGSATPSLESLLEAENPEKLYMIRLKKRVSGGQLPETEVVNLLGTKGIITPRLRDEMRRTLDEKKQVVLFLNRRGYNYSFRCNSCGFELTCPHCSVNLTYHKSQKAFVCHYCGHRHPLIHACPQCNSLDVSYSGFGTEKVEDEVRALFPEARIARLDADIASKNNAADTLINDFRDGKYDILLGTQMVAKGLNFPRLSLVGIVLADSTLNIPDFRSQERTFSLIVQVAGRSGRYDGNGKVIIQTMKPNAPAIAYAVSNRFDEFYEQELENRKLTAFPPYTRMVQIVFRSRFEKKAQDAASVTAGLFKEALKARKEQMELMGPSECPLSQIAGNFRYQILLTGTSGAEVHSITASVINNLKPFSGVYIEIDFDPLNLM